MYCNAQTIVYIYICICKQTNRQHENIYIYIYIYMWGLSRVAAALTSGVVSIVSNREAFVAIKDDGSAVSWGHAQCGKVF